MHLCHGLAFIEALSNYMLRAQCLNIFTRNINLFRSDLALVTAGVYLWYSTDGLREQRLNDSICRIMSSLSLNVSLVLHIFERYED